MLAVAVGTGVRASALVAREDFEDVGAVLPDGWADGEEAWILGFTQAELDAIPLAPTARAATAAGPGDYVLPLPAWQVHGAIEEGAASLVVDGVAPPELTVEGLPECPPVFGADSYADVRCRPRACVAPIRQEGCRVTIDEFGCEIGFEIALDGRGRPTFEGSACEPTAERAGSFASIDCPDPLSNARCPIDLYDGLDPISGEVLTATVYSVEHRFFPNDLFEDTGYLSGLAVLDDRVVVSGFGGAELTHPCPNLASALHAFRLDDLEPIGTSTSVVCLRELVAAEDRATFYALYGGLEDVRFGEFDRAGRMLREVARPTRGTALYGPIVAHADGRYATFVEQIFGTAREQVVTIDLDTFGISAVDLPNEPTALPSAVAAFMGEDVVVADRSLNRVVVVDVASGDVEGEFPLCGGAKKPEAIYADGNAVYAFAKEDNSALSVIDVANGTAPCVLARPFIDHVDTRTAVGRIGDAFVVAGRTFDPAVEFDTGRAVVLTYLPEREAYRAGALDIGFGLPTRAAVVDDVIFAILPWSAHVVRVTLGRP